MVNVRFHRAKVLLHLLRRVFSGVRHFSYQLSGIRKSMTPQAGEFRRVIKPCRDCRQFGTSAGIPASLVRSVIADV